MHPIVAIVGGFLIADFAAATTHWIEDSYLNLDTPLTFLREEAMSNAIHHIEPRIITTKPWYQTVRSAAILGILVFLVTYLTLKRVPLIAIVVLCAGVFSAMTHKFAHYRDCDRPAAVELLQSTGLFITREDHGPHHRGQSLDRYSTMLSFTNPVYDGLGVWRLFESVVFSVTGIAPQRKANGGVQPNESCPYVMDEEYIRNLVLDRHWDPMHRG